MTPEQLLVLKNFIAADPVLSTVVAGSDGDYFIAEQLNKEAVPSYVVWKTSVSVDDIMRNGMDWTRVDNLSVGKARIWDWLTRLGTINPSKANIRAGIDATWVGTAADLAVREVVYTHCKRNATVVEKLYAVGSGTSVSPSGMVIESPISWSDVGEARRLGV